MVVKRLVEKLKGQRRRTRHAALTGLHGVGSMPGNRSRRGRDRPRWSPATVPSDTHLASRPLTARAAGPLAGRVRVPGDKSLSHRALILGALATGVTRVTGLLEAEDVLNTGKALAALGAGVEKAGKEWHVTGRGVGGLRQPDAAL